MTSLGKETRQFSKYGIIGILNNAGLYLLFVLLIFVGVGPVISAGICYILGVAVSYALNRRWAFDSTNSHAQDLPRFLAAYGVGLICALSVISVLVLWMPAQIAQLFNIAITAVVTYGALRVFRFGNTDDSVANGP